MNDGSCSPGNIDDAKMIDDDVQRHDDDELLQVIKEAPDEIDAIVAKRRKDFTKEFFVHLHTVAESYYDGSQ
ncbi:hypothetical protein Cni_G13491 [Canna indica]|uniref:Uncharacterized protein n=1 Tax=Canna indica TaxID=4628 RepID=A0AAQ3QBK0_9LILI|nr:hypothetical protein Cni_G13491 [Canna indica]